MARRRHPEVSFDLASDQPLIGIPLEENGRQVVRYFTDEEEADRALAEERPQDGRHLFGAWTVIDPDLDWEEFADELDRIRHESKPTPPIDLDL
jgi:hypothetical protein